MARSKTPLPMAPNRLFGWLMEWMNAPSYRLAAKLLEPKRGEKILEIGFGTGKLMEMLARRSRDLGLAGVEPTEAMLQTALRRRTLRRLGDRLDLRLGTASELPWEAESFDSVAALHTFQFWEDPDRAAHEVVRVLRPGGRFVLILRDHTRRAPAWLPNLISRSGAELEGAWELLQLAGFADVSRAGAAGSSQAIVAIS